MVAIATPSWKTGPIGPGWMMMIAPLRFGAIVSPGNGPEKPSIIKDKLKRELMDITDVEALAILMLIQDC